VIVSAQPVGERDDAAGAGDGAEGVEPAGAAFVVEEHLGAGQHREPDREVDQQHPSPRQGAGEQPAEQDTGGDAECGHRPVHPHRLVAELPGREGGRDQGQRVRCGQGGADALDAAGADQQLAVGGEAAEHRGGGEHDHADAQHAAAAVQVADPATEEQQPAEGEHVGVDHPRQG
jgi:hypothetical protein